MKINFHVLIVTVLSVTAVTCQNNDPKATEVWEPEPVVVDPGATAQDPPSDAIILLASGDASAWQSSDGGEVGWTFDDSGALVVEKGKGAIKTKEAFGSIQLHLEWRTPTEVIGEGQGRGNSGLFLQERYEVQILDSYDNRTYSNGQAASIYKQAIPLANAMRGPGQWQTYDIIYHAPTFKDGSTYDSHPYVTVIHNGVVVQNHTKIEGATAYIGAPQVEKHGEAPLVLQDHGNPVAFRNIWVRRL